MPVYSYICYTCKVQSDRLCKWDVKGEQICEMCDDKLIPLVTAPAKTSANWGDQTGTYGVNGYYSKALGAYTSSQKEEAKIMKSRGFIPEADLPKRYWEDETSRRVAVAEQQDKYTAEYKGLLSSGKSKEEAIAETFSTERIMSGELEKTWGSTPITE